jgi:hypothetical protein
MHTYLCSSYVREGLVQVQCFTTCYWVHGQLNIYIVYSIHTHKQLSIVNRERKYLLWKKLRLLFFGKIYKSEIALWSSMYVGMCLCLFWKLVCCEDSIYLSDYGSVCKWWLLLILQHLALCNLIPSIKWVMSCYWLDSVRFHDCMWLMCACCSFI